MEAYHWLARLLWPCSSCLLGMDHVKRAPSRLRDDIDNDGYGSGASTDSEPYSPDSLDCVSILGSSVLGPSG